MELTTNSQLRPERSRQELTDAFGPLLEFDKKLGQFTSYGTGGGAAYFIKVTTSEEACSAIKAASKLSLDHVVIGGGTNLLVSDSGYAGLVIKIDVKGIEISGENSITCGSGEELQDLVDFATGNSLTGLEFAAGIVGSVGGAIYGNAGAYGGEIGNLITEINIIKIDGQLVTVPASYGKFSYRDSIFKETGEVIVGVSFTLSRGDKEKIASKVKEIIDTRHEKLPYDQLSAGCFFKNIPDPKEKFGKLAAGKLLEEIGAKGLKVGGAMVSDKHANIIINTGNASSKDIRELADKLKEKVKAKFGIILEEEVIQIGEF